ncbi:hypothetical protein BHL53_06940 [Bacillus cereus]|nr:hypothetical protein BHL53_06940 [Bacillus cereus]
MINIKDNAKKVKIPVILGFLGALVLIISMLIKDKIPYAPSIGWILCFILIVTATFFSSKITKS